MTRPCAVLSSATWLAAAFALTSAPACSGQLDATVADDDGRDGVDDESDDAPPPPPPACETRGGPPPGLRRLSHVEYRNTLTALLPGVSLDALALPDDADRHGFENDAELLGASPVLVERYEDTAFALAAQAVDGAFLRCQPNSAGEELDCGRDFIESFGPRAFRRPLADDETRAFTDFFTVQHGKLGWRGALQMTLAAFLQSPEFLYREETGDGGSLDGHAVASRLSYLLWQSMPDEELFEAARDGALDEPNGRHAQAKRLLADPRARATLVDFHRQWLDFDDVLEEVKDARLFPHWNDEVHAAVRAESDRFVAGVLFDGEGDQGGSLRDLLTSRTTYANHALGGLYGVEVADDGDWHPVSLPADERAGILTLANFQASHAHQLNQSPVLRGVAVMTRIFCEEPPEPPANVDTSNPADGAGGDKTNRQLFEQRTSPPLCMGCHRAIDNFGYAFENYDSTGRFQREENGLPIDASGTIWGTDVEGDYAGPMEFIDKIASSVQVRECYARHLLQFATGRVTGEDDQCRAQDLGDSLDKGTVLDTLARLVMAPEFVQPGKAVQP